MEEGSSCILEARDLGQIVSDGDKPLTILSGISFRLAAGSALGILGPSGSGKSTLLGLLAGLDLPTTGQVCLDGVDLGTLDEEGRADLRSRWVGFVFQSFLLLPQFTALENVMLPMELMGDRTASKKASDILRRVGLGDCLSRYPFQLSGGEQQRVAVARACVKQPKILFADEPTGNLDITTGRHLSDLLFEMNKDLGATLVLVTHDQSLAERCTYRLQLSEGHLVR